MLKLYLLHSKPLPNLFYTLFQKHGHVKQVSSTVEGKKNDVAVAGTLNQLMLNIVVTAGLPNIISGPPSSKCSVAFENNFNYLCV